MTDTTDRPIEDQHEPEEPTGTTTLRLAMLGAFIAFVGIRFGWPVLVVIAAISLMIFLHELGHYLTARSAGMKVTEFFLGFGPRIWSFHRGETEYGIKAIPAGAYVRIIGMSNLEEIDPADEACTYRQKPYWRRMSVAFAGSAMHFIIALVLLFVLFAGFGVSKDEVWHVEEAAPLVAGEESPAALAGFQPGDVVTEIDGVSVRTFTEVATHVVERPGDTVTFTIDRDGTTVETAVTLGTREDGRGYLGVAAERPLQRLSPVSAARQAATTFADITTESGKALASFFSPSGLGGFTGRVFSPDDDESAEPTGPGQPVVSSDDEGRLLSIYGAGRLGVTATENGVDSLLAFLVLINIFIGVFNLVPLLPLDGGHVAIGTYEKIREMVSRREERYFVDVSRLLPVTYMVVFVLISIGVMALYLDIVDPVRLPG